MLVKTCVSVASADATQAPEPLFLPWRDPRSNSLVVRGGGQSTMSPQDRHLIALD